MVAVAAPGARVDQVDLPRDPVASLVQLGYGDCSCGSLGP